MSETVNSLMTVVGICFAGAWFFDACVYVVDGIRFFKG